MPDLFIRIRENNRRILRGFTFDDRIGRYVCQIFDGETIKPQFNLADWLGSGATISSVVLTSDGGTVTQANGSGIITFTVSGVSSMCDTTATITASDGRVRIEKLRFLEPNCNGRDDYGSYIGA